MEHIIEVTGHTVGKKKRPDQDGFEKKIFFLIELNVSEALLYSKPLDSWSA